MASRDRRGRFTANVDPTDINTLKDLQQGHLDVVANILSSRKEWLTKMMDPRRNIDKECGYPEGEIGAEDFRKLYDRDAVAARVVEVIPKECWQATPLVYESEDSREKTAFELAWLALSKRLKGNSSWHKEEEGSPVWEYLKRADILSGIGSYGVILLGIDDRKPLNEPAFLKEAEELTLKELVQKEVEEQQEKEGELETRKLEFETKKAEKEEEKKKADAERLKNMPLPPKGKPPIGNAEPFGGPKDPGEFAKVSGTNEEDDVEEGDTEEDPIEAVEEPTNKLLYIRVFDESQAKVTQWETDETSPRFGQPLMYTLNFFSPNDAANGSSSPLSTKQVHWSRIVHVADNLDSSEVMGSSRMKAVYNRLYDLMKLFSGSAEMYWRGAFPGLAIETHPQLGGDVQINETKFRNDMEQYMNGLQRYLSLMGMTAKSLAPQVVDPTPQIQIQLDAICIKLGIPKRVFVGSERGDLASSQDDATWNGRLKERQKTYLTPRVIVPFIDRLIALGVLPEPEDGYCVEWPDLDSLTPLEQADVALKTVQTLTTYAGGNGEAVIDLMDLYVRILKWTQEEAESVVNEVSMKLPDDRHTSDPAEAAQAQAETFAGMPPPNGEEEGPVDETATEVVD